MYDFVATTVACYGWYDFDIVDSMLFEKKKRRRAAGRRRSDEA